MNLGILLIIVTIVSAVFGGDSSPTKRKCRHIFGGMSLGVMLSMIIVSWPQITETIKKEMAGGKPTARYLSTGKN